MSRNFVAPFFFFLENNMKQVYFNLFVPQCSLLIVDKEMVGCKICIVHFENNFALRGNEVILERKLRGFVLVF